MTTWKPAPYGMADNPGVYDTGNGAIKTIEESPSHPGVERITIKSYCGRDSDNCQYFRLEKDHSRTFDTLKDAVSAARNA